MDASGRISLSYDGGVAASGQMDHYAAANAIIAFGDFMGIVSRCEFGEGVSVETRVAGISDGCISLDFVLHLGGVASTLVSGPVSIAQFWSLMKEALGLWRFLRGAPPTQHKQVGDKIEITNRDGEITYVNANTLIVVGNEKAAAAVEQFIGKRLDGSAERLTVRNHEDGSAIELTQAESGYYVDVRQEQDVTDGTSRIALNIESAVFKEGNMWRFSDGGSSFGAVIEDERFLERVEDGERFGKGDVLLCEMRVVQRRRGTKLTTERYIVRVIDHIERRSQDDLF